MLLAKLNDPFHLLSSNILIFKKITVFWNLKLCHLVDMYRYFLFYPDDVQQVPWNADIYRVIQEEMLIFRKLIVLAIVRKKFHIIVTSNSEWLLWLSCLNPVCAVLPYPLDFCLCGWMKSEVYKIKVGIQDWMLGHIFNAAAHIKRREDQLGRQHATFAHELMDFWNVYYELQQIYHLCVTNLSFEH